jgi:hypothetical protein
MSCAAVKKVERRFRADATDDRHLAVVADQTAVEDSVH